MSMSTSSVPDGLAAKIHILLNRITTNMEIGMEIDDQKLGGPLRTLSDLISGS